MKAYRVTVGRLEDEALLRASTQIEEDDLAISEGGDEEVTRGDEGITYEEMNVEGISEAEALMSAAARWEEAHQQSGQWLTTRHHSEFEGNGAHYFFHRVERIWRPEDGPKRYPVTGGRSENYDFDGELTIEELRPLGERLNERNNAGIDLTLPDDALAAQIITALHSWGEESDETDRLQVGRSVLLA